MNSDKALPRPVPAYDGWVEHELSQLRRFRALSLREKLHAVEGMADVVRRFEQMRREGAFHSGPLEEESPAGRGGNDKSL